MIGVVLVTTQSTGWGMEAAGGNQGAAEADAAGSSKDGAGLQADHEFATQRAHIEQDLATLGSALRAYRRMALAFPSAEQGLSALVEKPTSGRVPPGYRAILKSEPLDPWGAPYGYRVPPTRGKGEPDIWSFGPDRIDATEDDFGNWDAAERLETEEAPAINKKIRGSWGVSKEGFLQLIKASQKVTRHEAREQFEALADVAELLFDKLVYEFCDGTAHVFPTSGGVEENTFEFISANGSTGEFVVSLIRNRKGGGSERLKGKISGDNMLLEQREVEFALVRLSDEESARRKEAIKHFDASSIQRLRPPGRGAFRPFSGLEVMSVPAPRYWSGVKPSSRLTKGAVGAPGRWQTNA